jgi:hypothetical protein
MNSNSVEIEQVNERKLWFRNYFLSVLFHLLLIAAFILLYSWNNNQSKINSIMFSVDTKEYVVEKSSVEEEPTDHTSDQNSQTSEVGEEIETVSFTNLLADTTNLDQLYTETSLNVKIKYPKGWAFIDQNKNKKLEGVTFWVNDGIIIPPPYLHLEVINKDMFIEKRYKYKTDFEKYIAYYNDPEELQDYLTRVIYIRTEDDQDFQLKLMIKGKNEFESFEPKFWAILKSFDFGKNLF